MTTRPSEPDPVNGEILRGAMRHVPAAVTVVTVGGDEPRGVTIASFSSVSLRPPLISFNLQLNARVYPLMRAADRYAIHVLKAEQVSLSDRFADPALAGAEQFEDVPFEAGADGLPLLTGALATFECVPWAVYDAGDHALFVGRVVRIESADEGTPVLYYQRAYRGVGGTLASRG